MNELVKEVNFQGQQILSIFEDNKIYVSIKSICDNLGMSKNQADTQVRKIRNDELLKGASKLSHLCTNGGIQEALMIELDYLPIWLAKINPARFNNELKSKLIIYQLKAKDALAETFLGKRESANKISNDWAIRLIIEKIKEAEHIEDKILDLKKELTKIYDEIDELIKIKRDDTLSYFETFKSKKIDIKKEKLRNIVAKSLID